MECPQFRNGRSYRLGEFGCSDSFGDLITLPNGRVYITGIASIMSEEAKELGWPTKIVRVQGACCYFNAIDRAREHPHFPIWIDGVRAQTMVDTFATDEEMNAARKEMGMFV